MKKIQLALLVCLVSAIASVAQAQSLGLNFAATDPNAADSSLLANEVAGVVPQANWNNLETANGTNAAPLVLDDGSSSTASVQWASPNTWRSAANNSFPAGPDRKLTNGYLDSNNTAAGGVMITVSNIDAVLRAPAYDVLVYFVGDNPDPIRGGGFTLDDGNVSLLQYGSTLPAPTGHVLDPGTDPDNTLDGTYLRFRGLTGSTFRLASNTELTTPNGFRAPINAIQIVAVPEPASMIIAACGLALLGPLALRRSRT